MSQYLSKFVRRLSDITKPLRDLTRQDAEWIWDEPQRRAFERLKQAVSAMPVLRYYNLKEDVTIQCDASQRGLSVALLEGGQPVAYASRVLTDTEVNYTQIEKELLAIVLAVIVFECRQITSSSSPFSGKNFVQPLSVYRGCCSGCKSTVWMSLT